GSSASAASATIATGINPATGKPWRSGVQEGVDFQAGAAGAAAGSSAAAASATGIDPATGKPWRSGAQEGADAASAGAADAGLSGSSSVERAAGSGPLEGAE
ncbi:MAG: hypothetical protein ABIS42_01660, partial [Candidatus Limnocylindria bacterium]